MTVGGYAVPNQLHLAAAAINVFKSRQRMSEILRGLPGSSLIVAPADTDFADPTMATELEDAYGGGGYTALQRAAVLHLGWDHVASELDARESVFELHASGGLNAWRAQLRAWFPSYDELANGVQQFLEVELPPMDLTNLKNAPYERPR
jgi:4-hydroxyphenylacetate 3-monooxygenase